jgi:penicillin-binding protein 2
MLTSIAGLEEKVITRDELIECLGIYDNVTPSPRCWIFRSDGVTTHGPLNLVGGLANSCNYYFYEVGYRLSTDASGNYNESLGLARLKTYAEKFGFGSLSGIELDETNPMVSDAFPVLSAIGQGTNNYTTVQLARYVTAIASSGNLYSLSLIDRVADADGRTITDYTPEVQKIEGVSQESFRTVQEGMRSVVREGTVNLYFKTSDIDIAGKTGSAQEDTHRPNHAHFVSYAPYDNPEIAVTASIRNGYTSAYTAMLVRNIYEYYYKEITLDEVISRGASNSNNGDVGD